MINENNIAGKAEELKNAVVGTAESKVNETKQNIAEAIEGKKREAEIKLNETKQNISDTIDSKKSEVETKFNETRENITTAIDDKKKQAEEKAAEVKDAIASKLDNEKKFAENKVNADKVNEAGNVVDGIRNAFAGKISDLASKISADDNKKV